MSWEKVSLAGIASKIQYGYTASALEEERGAKFLRITDIVPEQINWDSVPYCDIEENDFNKYRLKVGDIVIARTGNTTGYAKLIREDKKAVFASYLIKVEVDENRADVNFVGRLVESDIYKKFVEQHKGGAAQGNANAKTLTLFNFLLPPLQTQRKIAGILSAYDDLIENNLKRIRLLEESARLLYREWFVRLRFPGHEHTPINNGVPQGWEKKKIGDVLTFNYGKGLKQEVREDGDFPVYGSSGFVGTHSKFLVEAPGIVIGRKGNVGSVFWANKNYFPIDTVYFIEREQCSFYVYHSLQNLQFMNSDGAVPGLNRSYAYSLPILLPADLIRKQFEEIVTPIYEQTFKLRAMNEKLKQARDLLLPRLMSGEIAV